MQPQPFDAVVLAGGTSRRFGADKLAVEVDGVPLLDRVVAAAHEARRRVLVGAQRAVDGDVRWTHEEPPGGGPAAAVAAGLALVTADRVLLLAGDLPHVDAGTLTRLVTAADEGVDGSVLVDAAGRRQHLCTALDTAALRRRIAARDDWHGGSVHALLAGLELVEVAARGDEAHDIDTPHDLAPRQEHP